tara:strand:- start:2162 stop:2584 length:423 start_codon:yes stop_codon:yes gene_type:complete
MANQLYTKAKEDFLNGNLNLSSNTITICLVDTGDYTFNASHENRANIANAAIVATANLAGKSTTSGIFDATDAVFSSVTGDQSEALVLYHNVGNAEGSLANQASSRLIAYIDSATGLPVTPCGGDITVTFSNASTKIFSL